MPSSVRSTSLGLSTRNCTSTSAPARVVPSSLTPVTSTVGDSMWARVLRPPQPARVARQSARRRTRGRWIIGGLLSSSSTLPLHPQLQLLVALLVAVEEEPLAPAVEGEGAEDLDVLPAILLDEVETALADPFERLQAIGGLPHAQRLQREVPHPHPEAEARGDVLQQVERRQGAREVLPRVAGEDQVVEALDVEADHQRGAARRLHQRPHLPLRIDLDAPLLQEARHPDRDPHPVRLVPAADVGR